ncbi:JM142 [macacine gammaherpesvirus 11]|uniref:JM142 n=2 Tax=macacine gammaherpesvirus 11 TaxID=2560570 RepID=G9JMF0_9GAMA|nr:JM142 [Macaca fuscata rhadinovirus]AAT00119.1 JM142 [Macaca fuscata rhadinovirus]AEW87667.1 JM142 [Macaca fuscata rhadinovirus]AEW87837.1 JM142 [Macaca fuscata rhadinovirus]
MFDECPNDERDTHRPGAMVFRFNGNITDFEVHIGVPISLKKSTPSSWRRVRAEKNCVSETNFFHCIISLLQLPCLDAGCVDWGPSGRLTLGAYGVRDANRRLGCFGIV